MAEEKKDLTGLIQYSKELEAAGQAPPVPEGAVMEATPIEKIDDFESLEDYSVSHPPPPIEEPVVDTPSLDPTPPPKESAFTPPPLETKAAETPPLESQMNPQLGNATSPFELTPPSDTDFPTTPSESPVDLLVDTPTSTPVEASSTDFPTSPPDSTSDFVTTPADPGPTPSDFPLSSDAAPPTAFSETTPPSSPSSPTEFSPVSTPSTVAETEGAIAASAPEITQPPSPPEAPTASSISNIKTPSPPSLAQIKQFAEQVPISRTAIPASFPFSMLITGPLLPNEQEKLVEIIEQEKMGILKTDLEPQLMTGKILVPRISEYAGIMLIQALRGARAQIRFGPSDSIFSTADTRSARNENSSDLMNDVSSSSTSEISHPAEEIPVTSDNQLPGLNTYTVIDTMSASATLKSQVVEAESSSEYHEIIEALHREIKYKAYRRGATAILNFKIQLTPLSSPTHYRILTTGSAVKPYVTPPPLTQTTADPPPTAAAESSETSSSADPNTDIPPPPSP